MKCHVCRRSFRDGELVIPLVKYVVNEKRGDFVSHSPTTWVHVSHLGEEGKR